MTNIKQQAIDNLIKKIVSIEEEYFENKLPRVRKDNFVDSNYQLSNYFLQIRANYSDSCSISESLQLNAEFIEEFEVRYEEMKSFLLRHDIKVDVANDDYQEFELFVLEHADPAEGWIEEELHLNPFWCSIMVDFAIYVGQTKIANNITTGLRWSAGDMRGHVGGNQIQLGREILSSGTPLLERFLRWGDEVIKEMHWKERYVPLSFSVDLATREWSEDNNIDRVLTRRVRTSYPKNFVSDYTPSEFAGHYRYLADYTPEATKELLKSFLEKKDSRIDEITRFLRANHVTVDPCDLNMVDLELFLVKNIQFDTALEKQDFLMNDFWLSVMLDTALMIGDHQIERDETGKAKWLLSKKVSVSLVLKQRRTATNLFLHCVLYGDHIAGTKNLVDRPGYAHSLSYSLASQEFEGKGDTWYTNFWSESYISWYRPSDYKDDVSVCRPAAQPLSELKAKVDAATLESSNWKRNE